MGAEPWIYFVPYEANIESALQKLRQREFSAGRYFPISGGSLKQLGLSKAPATIDEAIELAAETGTQSILDIAGVGDDPDFGMVYPLPSDALVAYFQSVKPSRETVETNDDYLEEIERGHGVYIIFD